MTRDTQGCGDAGHFLGFECPYKESRYVILPVPFDVTSTFVHGSEKGPAALIEASRHLETYDIETDSEPDQAGIFTSPDVKAKTSHEMIEKTEKKTAQYLKDGKFVIGLGGEHSITPAFLKAYARHHDSFSVLQFDAHADLVPEYEGDPYNHACAMARVKEIPEVSHIVSVGIRSVSYEEKDLLDLPNTFFAEKIYDTTDWIDKAVDKLSPKVYITFDLDALDSFPATGTPEPGGIGWYTALRLLKAVFLKREVIGCDVMELCPMPSFHSANFLAAKLVYKMISYKEMTHGDKRIHEDALQTLQRSHLR